MRNQAVVDIRANATLPRGWLLLEDMLATSVLTRAQTIRALGLRRGVLQESAESFRFNRFEFVEWQAD